MHNLNEQCALLISQMNDIAWLASADGQTLLDLNDSFERIYGYSAQEFSENPALWLDVVHPDDREIADTSQQALFATGRAEAEYRIVRPDGSVRWIHDKKMISRDGAGNLLHMGGIASDVTERKAAEAQAQTSESRLAMIIESARIGTWEWDLTSNELFINERWAEIAGYTLEELAPVTIQTWLDLCHPDDMERSNRLLEEHFSGKLPYYDWECRMRHKDGEWIWVHCRGKITMWTDEGKPAKMYGTHTDITSRKRAERERQKQERFAQTVLNSLSAEIAVVDKDGTIISVNEPWQKFSQDNDGSAATCLPIGTSYLQICADAVARDNDETAAQVWEGLSAVLQGDVERFDLEYPCDSPTHSRWFGMSIVPIARSTGGAVISHEDITKRKETEKALRQSEERFRTVVKTIAEGLLVVDADGEIVLVNPSAESILADVFDQLFGCAAARATGAVIHEDGSPFPEDDYPWAMTLCSGQACSNVVMGIAQPNESRLWISVNAEPIFESEEQGPNAVLVTFRNITLRKSAEAAIRQREDVLDAVAFAAERLLVEHNWETEIDAILARMGTAADVSRVYLFDVQTGENCTLVDNMRFEWCAEGVASQHANPDTQHLPLRASGFGRWEKLLCQGEMLYGHVREFPAAERPILLAQGIRSMAVVPVMAGGALWGFVGFDQCDREREWSNTELEALRAAVNSLGAAIERQQAEETLLVSRERLSNIIESADVGTWEWNVQTGQTIFNERWAEIVGYTLEELAPISIQTWLDLCHPDDLALSNGLLEQHFSGRADYYDCECRMRHKDGHWVWVHDRGKIISRDSEGNPEWMYGTHTDVTNRRKAEESLRISEASLREAQKIAKVGSWAWDTSTDELSWSDGMFAILGLDPEASGGKPVDVYQFIHPMDRERVKDSFLQSVGDVVPVPVEYRIVTDDGTCKYVISQRTKVFDSDSKVTHLFGTVQDITERKQIEAEIIARQTAERASAAKSEFLSRMSHELRTPMNSILGFAQLLQMSQKEPLTTSQRTRVNQILKAGEHLLKLINEVLEISRIEAGRMELSSESVDVAQVALEVLELTQPLAAKQNIFVHSEIDTTQPLYITADLQRFKQVLINLVSNAIKYNKESGNVWLRAEGGQEGRMRVSVQDSGQGISREMQARLFQPFDRLGAEQSNVEGTGLGLALSQRLVSLMRGEIGVESVPGAGSTFWIELPAARHPGQGNQNGEMMAQPVLSHITEQPKTLLYVEDNLANFELVRQVMAEEEQVKLIWAMRGSAGLELAQQRVPNLILLDLHLPDMHGSEVLARLRQDEATHDIPVVVISADATPGQIQRLMDAGANAYLTKPLNVAEFLRTVQAQLDEE